MITIYLFLFFNSFFLGYIKSFYTYIIFINLYIIVQFRKNPAFLLFYIFCLFYTLSLIPYYFFGLEVSLWKDFNDKQYYDMAVRIYGCFLITPLIVKKRQFNFTEVFKIPKNANILGFLIFFTVSALIVVFGQSGSDIFESGGYATGESSKSTIYEYFILFFLMTYYYSNKTKLQLIILVSLGSFYVVKSLLYGGRIEIIQFLILCFYILIIDYKLKISPLKIILGCLVFYYINQVFSEIRSNPIPLLEGNYIIYLNPFEAFSNPDIKYVISNEGDVFQSSVRLIGLMENGLLDTFTRFKAFIGFFISIVVPSSWLPDEASLITYKKDIYGSGGGGLIAVYFYAFLGWLGPFIISAYLFWIYRLTAKHKTIYLQFYCLMVFSTFPRWFAYNPIILFKLCLWIIPVVFISNLILKKVNRYKNRNHRIK